MTDRLEDMTGYKVIISHYASTFMRDIERAVAEGYKPYGPPIVDERCNNFMQAMIKFRDSNNR